MPRFEVTIGVRVDLAYEVEAADSEDACKVAEGTYLAENWPETIKRFIGGEILASVAVISPSLPQEPTFNESGEYLTYPCANCGTLAPVPLKHDCLCTTCASVQ